MGGPKAEIPLVAVLESEQLRPIVIPSAGMLPEFSRLDCRQQHFLGAGAIHFFPDDLADLGEHPVAQRKPVVDTRGDLADQAGPQHELVTHNLCISRDFF